MTTNSSEHCSSEKAQVQAQVQAQAQDKNEFKGIKDPAKNDILCGRGGGCVHLHPGNETFRTLVDKHKPMFLNAQSKKEKREITDLTFQEIKKYAGSFLKREGSSGLWVPVSDDRAREKTAQALRENAPKIREDVQKEKDSLIMNTIQEMKVKVAHTNRREEPGDAPRREKLSAAAMYVNNNNNNNNSPQKRMMENSNSIHEHAPDVYDNHHPSQKRRVLVQTEAPTVRREDIMYLNVPPVFHQLNENDTRVDARVDYQHRGEGGNNAIANANALYVYGNSPQNRRMEYEVDAIRAAKRGREGIDVHVNHVNGNYNSSQKRKMEFENESDTFRVAKRGGKGAIAINDSTSEDDDGTFSFEGSDPTVELEAGKVKTADTSDNSKSRSHTNTRSTKRKQKVNSVEEHLETHGNQQPEPKHQVTEVITRPSSKSNTVSGSDSIRSNGMKIQFDREKLEYQKQLDKEKRHQKDSQFEKKLQFKREALSMDVRIAKLAHLKESRDKVFLEWKQESDGSMKSFLEDAFKETHALYMRALKVLDPPGHPVE